MVVGSAQKRRLKPKAVAGSGGRLCDNRYVRFTPKSGHVQCTSACPLCANSGHPWVMSRRPLSANMAIGEALRREAEQSLFR